MITGIPASAARDPRTTLVRRIIETWRITPDQLAGLGIDAFDPRTDLVHVPDVFDLAASALVHEDVAALVLVHDQLFATAVEEPKFAQRGVVIPIVMRDFLVVPLQVSRIGIKRQDTGGIQIVAVARVAPIVIRRWIAGAPE